MTTLTISLLLAAFAQVESSNMNRAPYWDVNGTAFGLYGFHQTRYFELGGTLFGHASRKQQDAVMTVEINRGLAIAAKRGIDPIRAVATLHNCGHVIDRETSYVKKIRSAINQMEGKQ